MSPLLLFAMPGSRYEVTGSDNAITASPVVVSASLGMRAASQNAVARG